MPHNWIEDRIAGVDWFNGFMKRHPQLSIRVPEATSLARVSNFNKTNVQSFFTNYEIVLQKYKFAPLDIYNMDESGLNTVTKTNKIVAERGVKQIGAITSAERGEQITIAATVSAAGNALPPFFIFPRVRFKEEMLHQAPEGSTGVANECGWMTKDVFPIYLKHFVTHARCSKAKRVLLLLDNHASHISLEILKFAKENGVIMLTFPPHCSHKLQPLDRSIFGPLKTALARVQSQWMIHNPKKTMKIQQIPGFVEQVYSHVFTIANIQSGFRVSGIHPFNSYIFDDRDFAPLTSIDRPINLYKEAAENSTNSIPAQVTVSTRNVDKNNLLPAQASTSGAYVTPMEIRPIRVASPANENKKSRRKGKTTILTDTPEMIELEKLEMEREAKNVKRKTTTKSKIPKKKKKIQVSKRKVLTDFRNIIEGPVELKIKEKKKSNTVKEKISDINDEPEVARNYYGRVKRERKANTRFSDYLCDRIQ